MSNGQRNTVLPYHFVPIAAGPRPDDVAVEDFHAGRPDRLGHHRFADGCRSGRILCRLTTKSPIFVGAQREAADGDQPATVEPFKLDDRPAIPASTLRGVVSSVAEAASGSALRVLDNRAYSFRSPMDDALSAIGEVIVEGDGDEKRYSLRPVVCPVLTKGKLPPEFKGWFSEPRIKVHVGIHDQRQNPLSSYRNDDPRFYGMRLYLDEDDEPRKWDAQDKVADDDHLVAYGKYLISQSPVDGNAPIPWDEIDEVQRSFYTKGIVRVMQDEAGVREFPEGQRKHELFLPYDPDKARSWKTFPIDPAAVERFHELADERTKAHRPGVGPTLPYEPVGTPRNLEPKDEDDRTFRLKTGDLVYFRPSDDAAEVAEIALSSIWRKRVEDRRSHQVHRAWSFFQAVDEDLVPFHDGRKQVTVAEQIFGFAGEGDPKEKEKRLPALKSRVRFADAPLDNTGGEDPWLGECTLKILDSPKPPSPNLYFIDAQGGPIEKEDLRPGVHRPQGRKGYVHQSWQEGTPKEQWPWRTDKDDHANMKTRINPLREGLTFTFHVDYDNLSDRELGLLLYALSPTESFWHKLGMGKAIGLGSVRIDVLGVFEVDRQKRYQAAGLFAPRYARLSLPADTNAASWPSAYEEERRAAESAGDAGSFADELRRAASDSLVPEVKNALERLGEEVFAPDDVSLPLVDGGSDETKSYEWFVSNATQRKRLEPIPASRDQPWPRLPVLRPPERQR